MKTRTSELIERLSAMESMEEINTEVEDTYDELKESLINRGYEFDKPSGEFKGGQRILSGDYSDYEYYKELNFIKNGLEDSWIAIMDDYENFKEIEDSINDITIKFF
jgi:hypothetical protein